jgi:ATP-dependent DNA helicase PIF1
VAKSADQILKEADAARALALQEIDSDPFIGYKTLDSALAEYRCNSQAEVLSRLLNRENLFISGPAGSGKSFVLNRFTTIIDAQFNGKFNVAVTASTGIAATIIGGQTIHSWAGLGIDTEPFDSSKVTPQMKSKVPVIRTTDVLIIDEISMFPAYLFDKLDAVLKWARRSKKPFGGIQLVLTGDFLQLPPVSKPGDTVDTGFAIQTEAWKNAEIRYCYMDKSHRATDKKLKYLLTKMSNGKAKGDPHVDDFLRSRMGSRQELCDPEKVYSTLFTVNKNVDEYNVAELAKNKSPLIRIKLEREGTKSDTDKIIKKYAVPEEVEYKLGATVMLSSNIRQDSGVMLANGSIGVVTGQIGGEPMVKFNDGQHTIIHKVDYPLKEKKSYTDPVTKEVSHYEYPIANVKQLPLKLGYAITVHRSQGQTFNGVVVDLSKVFTAGLGYVALSRVRQLDDLVITGWNPRALDLDPLSKKISGFVKRRALETREEFIAKRQEYEGLLTDELTRTVMWDVSESARLNGGRKDWVR